MTNLLLPGSCIVDAVRDALSARVVKLMKMRRILSLLIPLGLAGLGPLPVSACALVYSQPSECATPQTQTTCTQMGMDQGETGNGPRPANPRAISKLRIRIGRPRAIAG